MAILIENEQDKIQVGSELENLLLKAVELSLKLENFSIPSEISILITDDESIREVNREHRNIDSPTDVLSFPLVDMQEGKIISDTGDFDLDENLLMLGDIVLSIETAVRQAEEYGQSLEREMAFLVTHGVFHLLGYDHQDEEQEEKMFGKQENVLTQLGLRRNEK